MIKLHRILLASCVVGSLLAGTHALAGPPYRGGYPGGGYHHGGWNHGGWYRPGWYGGHYYTRYYYPPATTYVSPPATTYVPTVQRYLVPPEYAGTPAGSVINYGGANYVINGDGTMSPN
jgi:hypothetical protein